MRLLIIMPSAHPLGGAEEALVQLAKNAAAVGLLLNIVLLESGPMRATLAQHSNVTVTTIDAGRVRQVVRVGRTIKRIRELAKRCDLVLAWMTKALIYASPAAALARRPCVLFQMGLPDEGRIDRLSRFLPVSLVLGCSTFVAEEESKRRKRIPCAAVALGADMDRFDRATIPPQFELRRSLGLPQGVPLIGLVGRLQQWKGQHTLVRALPKVLLKHPDAVAVLVGGRHELEPEYETMLRRLVSHLSLQARVVLAGNQQNVPQWMAAMDLIIHASDREPFGIVVVEALAMGKPVIATSPGGPDEILDGGRLGTLIPYGLPDRLAEAICSSLQNPPSASVTQSVAEEARLRYSDRAYADRLASVLRANLTAVPHV